MRLLLFTILITLFTNASLYSQDYYSKSIDIRNLNNSGWQVLHDGDHLILVSANFCDTTNTNVCTSIGITDLEGNLLEDYMVQRKAASLKQSLVKWTDSTYMLFARPSPLEEMNVRLIELDPTFQIINEWEYGTGQSDELPFHWVNNDQGNLLTSATYNDGGVARFTYIDNNLIQIDQGIFPLPNVYGTIMEDDLIGTQDGHYIGTSKKWINSRAHATVTKFTNEMDILWHFQFEAPDLVIEGDDASVVELENGNLAVSWEETFNGSSDSISLYGGNKLQIYGLDGATSEELWVHTFLTFRPTRPHIYKLNRASNGDIIGIGYVYRPNGSEEWEWLEDWDYAGYIFRMTPDGELLWDRYIADTRSRLGFLSYFLNGTELPNGDLVFTGSYQDTFPNAEPFINNPNIWLVRTDSEGCLTPNCGQLQVVTDSLILTTSTEDILVDNQKRAVNINVFPNPTQDYWILDWEEPLDAHLKVIDMQGRVVHQQTIQSGKQQIPAATLSSGMYIFEVNSREGFGRRKVIKQ